MRVTTILLALALSGCAGAPPAPADPARPARAAQPSPFEVPPLAAVSSPAPQKPLPGLESITLEGRERELFWQTLNELYAPCPGQAVSIRQCIEETRPCAACKPAALLLGAKIREGASAAEAREVYGARFGPDVKPIDVADSPARGPANAPVTIVVWSDFECPHCKHAMPLLDKVFEKHAGQVRLVHKFYPLKQHVHAADAARAAIAAQNQGRYWEMERLLFENQDAQTESDLDGYAKGLKLDMNRFHYDMASPQTAKILVRDHDDAERAGLTGTPHIVINGRAFEGAHFNLNLDLDAWVTLEIELVSQAGGHPQTPGHAASAPR